MSSHALRNHKLPRVDLSSYLDPAGLMPAENECCMGCGGIGDVWSSRYDREGYDVGGYEPCALCRGRGIMRVRKFSRHRFDMKHALDTAVEAFERHWSSRKARKE